MERFQTEIMKTIRLSQGLVAVVDDDDYDRVSRFKWSATRHGKVVYAQRKIKTPLGRSTSLLLHRFLMNVVNPKIYVDHRDHDGLNCKKSNLRLCVPGENDGNQMKKHGTSSRYKGVSWDSGRKTWRAQITIRGRVRFLGRYDSEEDAAIMYDAAARSAFGEFAHTNFPLA